MSSYKPRPKAQRVLARRRYYAKHRNSILAKNKKWAKANRLKMNGYKKIYKLKNRCQGESARLVREYGVTLAQYDQMFISQNGNCAICGKNQKELPKRLSVDHDHISGKVRGLLCTMCNAAIGILGDSADNLLKALNYLNK